MLASLLLLAAIAACAPGSALALPKLERKAMTVKAIDGASTSKNASFVEITFKRDFEELFGTGRLRKGSVTLKFVPASGKKTKIVETGPAKDPKLTRTGTQGVTDSARSGRTLSVFARRLKAPAKKVIVTTRRGKKKIDKAKVKLSMPVTEDELELEIDEANLIFGEAIDNKTDAEYAHTACKERIAQLKGELANAQTRAEKRKLRKQIAKQKAKAADRRAFAKSEGEKADLIEQWIKQLEKALKGPAARECNDGVDNDQDSLKDFSGFDPGCVMQLDADEADVPMSLTCPSPGNTRSVTGTITIPTAYHLDSYYVSLPPPAAGEPREGLIDEPVSGSSGGPFELTWYKQLPCGSGISMSYGYAVFTAGVPQGRYGLRVALSATNPSDSGNGGGRQLSLRMAAGTSR
jgi:hypothetical protein